MGGDQVIRKREQRTGGLELIGGEAWLRIDLPAQVLWDDVLTKFEAYRYFLPYAVEVRQVGDALYVRHVVAVKEASYWLRFWRSDRARVLRFEVRPEVPGSVHAGWAELELEPLDDDASIVHWTVMADPDLGPLGGLFRGAVRDAMLDIPSRIRDYVRTRTSQHRSRNEG
jgi:hypothetical protein